MPILSDEEVLRFNLKIDELEDKRFKLDRLNDIYMRNLEIKKSQFFKSIIISAVLFICLMTSLSFLIFNNKSEIKDYQKEVVVKKDVKKSKDKELVSDKKSKKTILPKEKEVIKKPVLDNASGLYGVQIGAFKDYDVDYTLSIQKTPKGKLNCYIIGGFPKQESAEKLKKFLNKLGLGEAYIVQL